MAQDLRHPPSGGQGDKGGKGGKGKEGAQGPSLISISSGGGGGPQRGARQAQTEARRKWLPKLTADQFPSAEFLEALDDIDSRFFPVPGVQTPKPPRSRSSRLRHRWRRGLQARSSANACLEALSELAPGPLQRFASCRRMTEVPNHLAAAYTRFHRFILTRGAAFAKVCRGILAGVRTIALLCKTGLADAYSGAPAANFPRFRSSPTGSSNPPTPSPSPCSTRFHRSRLPSTAARLTLSLLTMNAVARSLRSFRSAMVFSAATLPSEPVISAELTSQTTCGRTYCGLRCARWQASQL